MHRKVYGATRRGNFTRFHFVRNDSAFKFKFLRQFTTVRNIQKPGNSHPPVAQPIEVFYLTFRASHSIFRTALG